MATYYALPALTVFDTTNGWSLTSGGPGAGTGRPGVADTAVIDINSGPPRSINWAGGGVGRLVVTSDAQRMTLTGIFWPKGIAGTTQSLAGLASVGTLYIDSLVTVTAADATVDTVQLVTGGELTLGGDMLVTNGITMGSTSTGALKLNGYSISADFISGSSSVAYSLGNGTLELRGGNPWRVTSSTFPGTGYTVKFSNKAAGVKVVQDTRTYANIWNDTGVPGNPSAGGLEFSAGAPTVLGNYRASPGSVTILGNDMTAGSYTLDGAGVIITLRSTTSGIGRSLTKTGGGQVLANYCSIKDVSGALTNGATWRALNSINGGNTANWVFIPNNSRLLMFY